MPIPRRMWPKVQPGTAPRHSRSMPPAAVRRKVWIRAERCCERCGIECTTFLHKIGEIHHRRNRSQGVDNSLPNLVLLCHLCHVWVGADPKAAQLQGFHLAHGQAPHTTPLLYGGPDVEANGRRWRVLDAAGGVHSPEEEPQQKGTA